MNEPRVIWGSDGFATTSGWETTYCIDQHTKEYLTVMEAWISVGTGLPAGSYLDAPPVPQEHKAIVRTTDSTSWEYVTDLRGTVAYKKSDCTAKVVDYLGDIQDEFTLLEPNSPNDTWNGTGWTPYKKPFEEVIHNRSVKYDEDLFYLQRVWLSAAVMDGQEELGRKQEVEQEIEDLKVEYLADVEQIKQEYGVT